MKNDETCQKCFIHFFISLQPASEQQEELQATVYLSSQEELDPPVVTHDEDGTTVVKTRQQTTHRIVYTIHKPSGKILSSSRESSSGTLSKKYQEEMENVETNFADISLVVGDEIDSKNKSPTTESSSNLGSSSFSNKSPIRKITLTKLTDAMRPGSPKNK